MAVLRVLSRIILSVFLVFILGGPSRFYRSGHRRHRRLFPKRLAFYLIISGFSGPHLKETFIITFVNELMVVLNLLGVLGIFNVFLGGTEFTPSPPLFHSLSHEWAGLIGQARGRWFQAQWTLLVPLLFIESDRRGVLSRQISSTAAHMMSVKSEG